MTRDPRTEAEKARAALARNAEMGTAVPQSLVEREPSVTPQTFGDTTENGRVRSAMDDTVQEVQASRDIGDSTGTPDTSQDRPVRPGHAPTPPTRRGKDEDVLSRSKE